MKKQSSTDLDLDLPNFDVPQQEPPAKAQDTSYEDAVRSFEEIIKALKLWEQSHQERNSPEGRFEL